MFIVLHDLLQCSSYSIVMMSLLLLFMLHCVCHIVFLFLYYSTLHKLYLYPVLCYISVTLCLLCHVLCDVALLHSVFVTLCLLPGILVLHHVLCSFCFVTLYNIVTFYFFCYCTLCFWYICVTLSFIMLHCVCYILCCLVLLNNISVMFLCSLLQLMLCRYVELHYVT